MIVVSMVGIGVVGIGVVGMPVIVMSMIVVTTMGLAELDQVFELFGRHQAFVRISDSRQVLGARLDVQLAQHAITAYVGMLL